jgi:membrane protein implicated in regulation of membrane protease activity
MISNQTLILIAIILILVDIFFPTDITTFIAYIIFSYLVAHNTSVPVLYQIITGILAWWVMVALHYYVFRKYIRMLTDKLIAPTKIQSGIKMHYGKTGQVKVVENTLMFQVGDEVYPFTEQDGKQCNPGDYATIINYSNEKLTIEVKY